jgi:4'-phosphopantetheinyl transferase
MYFVQIGRLLIRKVISENTDIPYKAIKISRTEKGRPYVTNEKLKFDFNVSHQGDYSVIGAESGTMVGSDIMKLEAPSKYIQSNLSNLTHQGAREI